MEPCKAKLSSYALGPEGRELFGLKGRELFRFPGFCDVHVHLREPGFSYKETIRNATLGAAKGGYTALCAMPNLSPVPDSTDHLREETDIIERDAVIAVYPYASITVGEKGAELSDMADLAPHVIAFSDDGVGVQDEAIMRRAFERAAELGALIAAHCEQGHPARDGVAHDGEFALRHGLKGISSESEWKEVERDIRLADETGCAFHICHVSTRESVSLIRDAKKSHVNVTAETCPHYLLLDDSMIRDEARFKMNPPIRSPLDRKALLDALCDFTIDMIVTDHAPHSRKEKSGGFLGSSFGVSGLETAFPVLYTGLVREGIISLERLIDLIAITPRKRFSIAPSDNDYTVWDLESEYTIDPESFLSMGRSTPFEGMHVFGKCLKTVYRGKTVYEASGA